MALLTDLSVRVPLYSPCCKPRQQPTIRIAWNMSTLDLPEDIRQIESPMERALELLGDRYSLLIVAALLQFGKLRFVELEHQITGISPRTLSARLKHLERHGMLQRQQFPTIPPKVEYSLTEVGTALAGVLSSMQQWANHWFPHQPDPALPTEGLPQAVPVAVV
jgi:DNA-binding HxlR family transcriptional regulator